MRKKLFMSFLTLLFIPLVACSNNNNNAENNLNDELLDLKVEFDVPESIEVGETLELKAIVTYGDEKVTDADDVNFEYWEEGNKDDSEKVDAKNNEDGTYTADVTFDDDAVIVMYAHTTARDLHTMPKRTVIVGDAVSEENDDESEHVEGFSMDFTDPDDPNADEETELMVQIEMDEAPLDGADVRYEIWNNDDPDHHDWIDTEESEPGNYTVNHTFPEAGTYSIQVHVEDDNDLHEHETYEVEVGE